VPEAARLLAVTLTLITSADLLGLEARRFVQVNLSPSLPRGLYRPVSLPLARGRLVSACIPETMARVALHRGYLSHGKCPGDAAPVLKILAGLPGDRIDVTASGVLINGTALRSSAARAQDGHGRRLSAVPPGVYRLRGCYWLASPHPESWDSRYFGCLPPESIRDVLVPVWTASPLPALSDFPAGKTAERTRRRAKSPVESRSK
jgi:conjugative transfer signal peptidase TraF